jgi:hypothetical protein
VGAFLFCSVSVALLVSAEVAVAGRRGQVGERRLGGGLPAVVARDPELAAQANRLVATWCTVAAGLCVVPLLGLAWYGLDRELSASMLSGLALWGLLFACVGHYPFERIRQLAGRPQPDRSS